MPEYMLLLYAPEGEEQEDRWADMPLWLAVTESLRKAGLLVANGPLHPVTSARTQPAAADRMRPLAVQSFPP
ncbi:hypothetical protein N5079_14770 [Planotetraspora sp. A-T 1434]|uniref:hypothetical protein n=1 Tax=Planotetraspora sp. A-T 1434 TaxID=2979219 RepID=UPI0021C1FB4E|nr:hypothetical protein [Planotetraspora sp. A-T 1434]MCT9931481.1 hypothetical protein [Planotetraspora sp. A-T 1434]